MKFKSLISAAAVLTAVAISSSAMATVTVVRGNDKEDIGSNILFDNGETCVTLAACNTTGILGDVNNGPDNAIRFTSSTDVLVALGSGQARISSTDTNGLNQLTATTISTFLGFEAFQLAFQGDAGTTVQFQVEDQLANTPTFIFDFTLLGSPGRDRFTFETDEAQFITSLSFTSSAGVSINLDDARQLRTGSLVAVPGPLAGAGLPGLLALGGFVWARRRQAATA